MFSGDDAHSGKGKWKKAKGKSGRPAGIAVEQLHAGSGQPGEPLAGDKLTATIFLSSLTGTGGFRLMQ
jgi:hypothetical protein